MKQHLLDEHLQVKMKVMEVPRESHCSRRTSSLICFSFADPFVWTITES